MAEQDKVMRVRIIGSPNVSTWYSGMVGKVISVKDIGTSMYYQDIDGSGLIRQVDCKLQGNDEKIECESLFFEHNKIIGNKHDNGKPDWTLLPVKPLVTVIRVLEHGLVKYSRDNWKQVKDGRNRYLNAAFRHLASISDGEWLDEESGLPHAAHAVCCLLFLLWFGTE